MRWLAIAILVGGCSALTDFDYTVGVVDAGGTDAGATDGGLDADVDAGTDAGLDASMDGGTDAGSDAGNDAGILFPPCPSPCLGEVGVEYVPEFQGVGELLWRYVEDTREPLGIDYPALGWDSTAEAFVSGAVSIGRCTEPSCPVDSLLMSAPMAAAGSRNPTIELTTPVTGTFTVGVGHASFGGGRGQLLLSRASRADALGAIDVADLSPATLDTFEVFLVAGDTLRVTLRPGDAVAAPRVAVNVWLSGPTGAVGTCQTAIDFDAWPGPTPQFGDYAVALETAGSTAPTMSSAVDAAFGSAVRIAAADDSYVRLDSSEFLDLSGDFTIQLWARREATGSGQIEVILSNPNLMSAVAFEGGLTFDIIDTEATPYLEVVFFPQDQPAGIVRTTTFDPGTDWHFYRIVRTGTRAQLCADGVQLVAGPVPGDLTSPNTMRLGRFGSNGVWITSSLDELRIFTEALPCEAAP